MSAATAHGPGLPAEAAFLAPLAERARRGDVLVRRDIDPRDPRQGGGGVVRRSAVLIHLAGTGLHDAQLVLEERGHSMRSQPGQFSLPGGGRDPGDRDDVHTALREAAEETGLDPAEVLVLGAFAPIPMPWRSQAVTPVLSWSSARPPLGVQDPFEVERVVWAPLAGPGSLTDPAHQQRGMLRGFGVGPAFDLPGDAFVWGFTAMILEKVLTGLGLEPVPSTAPVREIPPERRR
ncbi:coenzyme A pyrophosphatase [Brachybacterium vulturis]|uniref:Coenzyme A pyrophosphatase n=1 Tax=Brachybacterium vulturis TaxID=2017484 RepID=A0A291GM52_9MICO|nr:CoA pyrophosphatase [Brachybacterium vulturis]ATG51054.1 coenzyme A pyrophosphatase [Brachybacterium vulturis]